MEFRRVLFRSGAGFFRLRQTEFRRRYGLYAKGAEKFPDLADLAGIVTGDHQLAGLELSAGLFLALRFVHRPTAPVTAASCAAKIWLQPIRAKSSTRRKFSPPKHSPSAVACAPSTLPSHVSTPLVSAPALLIYRTVVVA